VKVVFKLLASEHKKQNNFGCRKWRSRKLQLAGSWFFRTEAGASGYTGKKFQ
jgi:hypothetical protein